jgi:hypothetical protein
MSALSHSISSAVDWRVLYRQAFFESDRTTVQYLVARAENAILSRLEDLSLSRADHIEEEQILDDALYTLQALRTRAVSQNKAA